MPVTVRKRRGKYRVVEKSSGRIAKTKTGRPLDGGGHKGKNKAGRQVGHINK